MAATIKTLVGEEVHPWLDALAALRIEVFHDYPYLYEGSLDYERRYLTHYAASGRSLFVLACDGDQIIGASTGIPLLEADAAFAEPFGRAGIDPAQVYYFGESVLRHDWRGKGLGHVFFDQREAFARKLELPVTAFCAVIRPEAHSMKPANYRPLDAFWHGRGYRKADGLVSEFHWRDVGESGESTKLMQFWLRTES